MSCLYRDDEPIDVYHAQDGDSNSRIKEFRRSARTYNELFVARTLPPPKRPSDAFDLGNATHSWILEPHKFKQTVKLIPGEVLARVNKKVSEDGARKGGAWDDFVAANPGKILLKRAAFDQAKGMRESVLSHPAAKILIDSAIAVERSIYWHCKLTGLPRRCRPDLAAINAGDVWIGELKTCLDSSEEGFSKIIHNLGYDIGARYYSEGWTAFDRKPRFAFIAVEKTPPYVCRLHEMHKNWMEAAKYALNGLLKRLAECHDSGRWQMDEDVRINLLDKPTYAFRRF